jgi:F-type H+-transporting ATPase subunit b
MYVLLTAETPEAEHAVNPLIPHPVEIVLSLVVFGLLYYAIKRFVVPSFERTFHDRTQAIEGGLRAAETKQAEADARLAELEQRLGEAKHEAARIREEAREQGSQIVAEMRAQAQTEAGRIVDHGKAQIEAERQQAVTSLRAEVGSLATALAGRIVGESLEDDARSTRVVDRFLADLESSQPTRPTAGATTGAPTGAPTGATGPSTGPSTGSSALPPAGPAGEPS